jgi:hypothetical protein
MNTALARNLLVKGELRKLFIESLGWDNASVTLKVNLADSTYTLHALAQKRGMVAFHCPAPAGQRLPDYGNRRKIEHDVAKSAHEHLIVFTDAHSETQIWQWVKREPGMPIACREHAYHRSQPGDALLQKLCAIAFSMEEEAQITLLDVTGGARAAFDVEKVTKKFYDRFQKEHAAFLKFITGIPVIADREWYASVMLNRLMFVYFIQRKGFLDGDHEYLRNRLNRLRAEHGKDKFYSFYRYFLLRLFHEGLGGKKRTPELEKLVGRIPYLNGGLFDIHELEKPGRYGKDIQIPDRAFERVFDYFDQYQWCLDERPLRADNEINPDVLGYIFEKYINQKQMGAYYTKEDITGYIAQNTIIPFLLDEGRKGCAVAFAPEGSVWRLLKDDPDRYIYDAMKKGADLPLPAEIEAGVSDVQQRAGWNRKAPEEFALPTEIWREAIDRHQRYRAVKAKLAAGEVHQVNDLVTLNLNIRQFAQDAIQFCEGPELLRAIWKAIEKVSVLDPTCGSGAFLFAALNILKPLYEACLIRMQGFIEDMEAAGAHRATKFEDFKKTLAESERHPKQDYFILKAIIVNNLFGVDIMEEAVEICKLRLFLKLVAQVESQDRIEPLPDIDFNIRAGNTLVGYARFEDVEKAVKSKFDFGDAMSRIEDKAKVLDSAVELFRKQQTELDGTVTAEDKAELRRRFSELEEELNDHLSGEYGVKKSGVKKWKESHKPFHWFCDFHRIVAAEGFDVVIGNPPYVETKDVDEYGLVGFETAGCGDLYAHTMERSLRLVKSGGQLGFIIPLSAFTVDGFSSLQSLYLQNTDSIHISNWSGDAHPSKLFEGVDKRLHIVLARAQTASPALHSQLFVSKYIKWYAAERPVLFQVQPRYGRVDRSSGFFKASLPKISEPIEAKILTKLKTMSQTVGYFTTKSSTHRLFYTRKASFFMQFLNFIPELRDSKGNLREPSELKILHFTSKPLRDLALACLSSSLFYFFYTVNSDCRNLNKREIVSFPMPKVDAVEIQNTISSLINDLMASYRRNSYMRTVRYQGKGDITVQYFNFRPSKPVIDTLDVLLAPYYGLDKDEVEFIVNYGIKYRMGADADDDEK